MIVTPLGPVPYEGIKKYLPKETVKQFEQDKPRIMQALDAQARQQMTGEEYYIFRIASNKGWDLTKTAHYIENLTKFSPAAALLVILREIAVDLDDQHDGHIEDSEEIWTISLLNGKVEQVDKSKVKNYRSIPAFRSQGEAKLAHRILSKRIRRMFKGSGE